MSRPDLIPISMACNDPDNGDFTGRVCQISLPDGMLALTAKAWSITSFRGCPKLVATVNENRDENGPWNFRLSGKLWPYVRYKNWAGSWCWDSFSMTTDTATEFLTWLHGRQLFCAESGWTEFFDAWQRPAPLVLPERWWVA